MNDMTKPDIRARLGLRPIINVSGTMTALGASIVTPDAIQAAMEILPQWVEINDLHRKASHVIAEATGAEAGFVTACASAGMSLAIAGAMTGADLAKVEQLPDATGMKDEVVILMGHMTGYGAAVEQAIRLTGAKVVPVGNVTDARGYQLAAKINERTAAALYVVSHHVVHYGQMPLEEFAAICHAKGVPVIADLASECDLRGFLAAGADVAVYSAHKFLGGMTAGIVAGRKDLVRATFLQNSGIGRGMKVGKEEVCGLLAAVERYLKVDHAAEWKLLESRVSSIRAALKGVKGVQTERHIPEIANELPHVTVEWDEAAKSITGQQVLEKLKAGDPPIHVQVPAKNKLLISVWMMRGEEHVIVGKRLKEILG